MNLYNRIIIPLNEEEDSKYGLSNQIISGAPVDKVVDNTNPEFMDADNVGDTNPDNTDGQDDQTQNQDGTDPTEVGTSETEGDDQDTDEYGNPINNDNNEYTDEQMQGDGDTTENDVTNTAQNTPGLRMLSSLSDGQYKLCNVRQYEKFVEMYNDVKNAIDNIIPEIGSDNPRIIQCKKIVANNLSSMLNDLFIYMQDSYSDTYETNVVAYSTFAYRYKICLDIIEKLKKNNIR